MPLIQVNVFEDELSQEQSKDLINKITDAVTEVTSEYLRGRSPLNHRSSASVLTFNEMLHLAYRNIETLGLYRPLHFHTASIASQPSSEKWAPKQTTVDSVRVVLSHQTSSSMRTRRCIFLASYVYALD